MLGVIPQGYDVDTDPSVIVKSVMGLHSWLSFTVFVPTSSERTGGALPGLLALGLGYAITVWVAAEEEAAGITTSAAGKDTFPLGNGPSSSSSSDTASTTAIYMVSGSGWHGSGWARGTGWGVSGWDVSGWDVSGWAQGTGWSGPGRSYSCSSYTKLWVDEAGDARLLLEGELLAMRLWL